MGRWLVVAGLLLVAAFSLGVTQAEAIEGRVVRVGDKDTLVVVHDVQPYRTRLSRIDAPERDQPWGDSATREMRRLVAGKDVSVDWYKPDRWGRFIGNVYVDGEDAGLVMVERGMAWHFERYADEQTASDRAAYSDAENAAKAGKRGMWSDPRPVPPWEWRRR